MKYKRLISVDPSLTCSGWALFSVDTERVLGVGKLRSAPPSMGLQLRMKDLQEKVEEVLDSMGLGTADLLVCEAETTVRDPRAAFRVERVRSLFEVVARARGLGVPGRLNPRTVQSELMGLKGRQPKREVVKEIAVNLAANLFAGELGALGFDCSLEHLRRNQDIVDALLVGTLALSRIKSAISCGIELEESFSWSKRRGKWANGENSLGWSKRDLIKLAKTAES